MRSKSFLGPVCTLVFFLILSFSCFASLNVPLTVTDYAGMNRTQEPVTSGVPLPESANIISTSQLILVDSQGNPVPAQFTVLSRWHGTPDDETKPIKWVLIDFQANVPENQSSVYYLKDNGNSSSLPPIYVQEESDKIIVNTGKAKFQISKKYFNLFDYVWIDADNDGQIDDLVLDQQNEGGLVLIDDKGKKFLTTLEPPEKIEIEEHGPMRTVIRIRGVFKSQDGSYFAPSICQTPEYPRFCQTQFYPKSFVYYNVRIYFYRNKDYVRVFLTLENNGANGRTNPEQYYAPIQVVYFDSVNLILKPKNSLPIKVFSYDTNTTLNPGEKFVLYQDWHENLTDKYKDTLEPSFEKGIFYVTKKNDQKLTEGKTNPGWIEFDNNQIGISLAIRHFWQNFPKKITVNPSEIKIGFWPEEGYYPYCQSQDFPEAKYDIYCRKAGRDAGVYLFDAGRHKTYEFFLKFHRSQQDGNNAKYLYGALKEPLMALAPPTWYAETKALGMIAPAGLTSSDPELNEALQRYERLQSALVYEEDSDNGWTILNIKTVNPPHWEFTQQNRFWGWMNFGDLLWSGQSPSSLHYDWPYSMFLHYIRTGKRKFFDVGVEMVRHRYDIDQYHGDRIDINGNYKWINHFQFYESSGHADPNLHASHPSKVSLPTHTWNGGLILYYLLTGEKAAWESAEENGKAILNYYNKGGLMDASTPKCLINGELRREGWSILNLVNLYRVTGENKYIQVARNIAKNILIFSEKENGSQGYWGGDISLYNSKYCKENDYNRCGLCVKYQHILMICYIIDGLINVHYETKDPEIKALIIRLTDFLKDKVLFGGTLNKDGKYQPLQVSPVWLDEDPDGTFRLSQLDPNEGAYYKLKNYAIGSPIFNTFWADLFAYTYFLTGNSVYLNKAKQLFKDTMFYYNVPGKTFIDLNYRSKISYIEGQFPNSHTKAHGWIGRTNQIYLYTEWQLNKGNFKIITNNLPIGKVGKEYYISLIATGGKDPYFWSLKDGNLPSGLHLSSTGVISGIPLEEGIFDFTVKLLDSESKEISRNLTILIKEDNVNQDSNTSTNNISDQTDNNDNNHDNIKIDKQDGSEDGNNISSENSEENSDLIEDENGDLTEYKIFAEADTTISNYSDKEAHTNFGGSDTLRVWGNGTRRILIKFDLSQIPSNINIEKAQLKLYCYSIRWPNNPEIFVYRLTHDWEEGSSRYGYPPDGATWIEYDYYDHDSSEINNWSNPGGDIDLNTDFGFGPNGIVAKALVETTGWVTLDITNLVQKWIDGEIENYGLLIETKVRRYNSIKFYSSEADPQFTPQLIIKIDE